MKTIVLKFANPVTSGDKTVIDVMATSDSNLKIFGINLRFLYDTAVFKPFFPAGYPSPSSVPFTRILLPEGYKQYNFQQGNPPYGNSPTLAGMFGWAGPLTYVNGAVELTDTSKALEVKPTVWTKVLSVELTNGTAVVDKCAPFIWDKRPNTIGGYIGQGDGLTVTEYTGTVEGTMRSAQLSEVGLHWNWSADPAKTVYPWGQRNTNNCI